MGTGRGLKIAWFSKATVDLGFSRGREVVAVVLRLQINGACTQKFEIWELPWNQIENCFTRNTSNCTKQNLSSLGICPQSLLLIFNFSGFCDSPKSAPLWIFMCKRDYFKSSEQGFLRYFEAISNALTSWLKTDLISCSMIEWHGWVKCARQKFQTHLIVTVEYD